MTATPLPPCDYASPIPLAGGEVYAHRSPFTTDCAWYVHSTDEPLCTPATPCVVTLTPSPAPALTGGTVCTTTAPCPVAIDANAVVALAVPGGLAVMLLAALVVRAVRRG